MITDVMKNYTNVQKPCVKGIDVEELVVKGSHFGPARDFFVLKHMASGLLRERGKVLHGAHVRGSGFHTSCFLLLVTNDMMIYNDDTPTSSC